MAAAEWMYLTWSRTAHARRPSDPVCGEWIALHVAPPFADDRIGNAKPVERTLVAALARRYPSSDSDRDFDRWTDDHADAMREVFRAFPPDPDVCTLFVDG